MEYDVPEALQGVIDEKALADIVREHPVFKSATRDLTDYKTRADKAEAENQTFQAEKTTNAKKQAFAAAELVPEWADLYGGEDLSKDALVAFATAHKLIAPAQEAVAEPKATVTPTVTGTPPGPQKMSREDFDQLMRSDPARALSMKPEEIAWRHQ